MLPALLLPAVLAVAPVVGPTPAPATAPADAWELRHAFLGAPRVAVVIPAEVPRAAAARALGDDPVLTLVEAAGPDEPRILALADPAAVPADLAGPLERMGLAFVPDGFTLHGRAWDTPEEGFVATFEDPSRPGVPVTLWYANSEPALAAYLQGLEATFTPGFAAFRGGEIELAGALAPDGRLLTGDLSDRRGTWLERFAGDSRITLRGFEFRVPASFDPDRATSYLAVLEAARERTLAWCDASGEARDRPVGVLGPTHVTLHGHAEEMLALLGDAVLSRVNPVNGHVHVLLAAGLPDDGGAAVAASAARRLLGHPAAGWLDDAAGVAGAGSWWGVDLDLWVAHLADGGLAPDLPAVLAGEGSPHLVAPLRAFWLERLLERRGAAFVRDLWTGEVVVDVAAEAPTFAADLAAHAEAEAERLATWRQERALRATPDTWRAGAALEPGPAGAGYGSRSADDSLAELAGHGAGAFGLRVTAYLEPSEPWHPGRLHRPRVAASASDAVLASALAAGEAAGLRGSLSPLLVSSPHGSHTADRTLATVARTEAFFAEYEPFLVHYALLAELCRVDLLSVGTGLGGSTKPPAPGRETPAALAVFAAKEAGWRHLVARTRGAFLGLVTYTAASPSEVRRLTFHDALDLVALELFHPLEPPADEPGGGPGMAPDPGRLVLKLAGVLRGTAEVAAEAGKPLVVLATGFASTSESWRRPHLARGITSPDTQALLYAVLAQAIGRVERRHPGVLRGLYLWSWSSYPEAGGLADRGWTPQHKPALEVLPRLFAPPGDAPE